MLFRSHRYFLAQCFSPNSLSSTARNTDTNSGVREEVQKYLAEGVVSLSKGLMLDWPINAEKPAALTESPTYRYLWHALRPALSLLVHARETGSVPALCAARDIVNNWLDHSFFSPDSDRKWAWYDHGTAERLLVLLLMYDLGLRNDFDHRFMERLRLVIFRHGQLLESEAFYASHQPMRYHNHAWFQDIALIAAAMAFSDLPCAERWLARGVERLEDQFDKLIIRENEYSIFAENSIGYHHGIETLAGFASDLVGITGRASRIPETAEALNVWSQELLYPDGRSPSQGDTFRRPNPTSVANSNPFSAWGKPRCLVLPKAGYAVVKGNDSGSPFAFCMFATSVNSTHKHEDNLAITLFFDGVEWLIDPSFYSHEYAQPLPAWLRSAHAHNCVAIGDVPYSIAPGNASIVGDGAGMAFYLHGTHGAYEGYEVSRNVRGDLERLDIVIEDCVRLCSAAVGAEGIWLGLHFGEGVRATVAPDGIHLAHPCSRRGLVIACDTENSVLVEGFTPGQSRAGATGVGFMQAVDTVSAYVPMTVGQSRQWRLRTS